MQARIQAYRESQNTMPLVQKSALVAYAAERMFALVEDFERYTEFLPWCAGAEVLSREGSIVLARLHIDYRGIRQSFTTENTNLPGEAIHMRLRDGPFEKLEGGWKFHALAPGASKVELTLDYAFTSALLEKAVGPVFSYISNTMVERFVARADHLYRAP
jgi:ribosome-associated toxin RatA of RatAB toxin-antitoxin module